MKLILVTLVACAFAAQDTTPPVISLTLPAAAGKISANDASAGADAYGTTYNFHNHGVKDYSSSAATECTAGASYDTCAEPSCEAHDHHDQSVECNKPKKYLIKQHADGRIVDNVATQYTLTKDAGKEYQTCGDKADGTEETQCVSNAERKYLAQWLLVYTASDDSGNAADQVTFSFVFVDLFAPELQFGSENGLEYGVGFENYQVWGDVKQRFEGNLKNNLGTNFAPYDPSGEKEFTRLCAIETGCSDASTKLAWKGPSSEKPIDKSKDLSTAMRGYGLALVAGNQDVNRYGAIKDGYEGDYSTGGDRASTHCMYTMNPQIVDNDEEKYNTNPVKYRIDGTGDWEDVPDAGIVINTLTAGDDKTVTVDFHVEDNTGRFGYKSKNNQNLHRVEFIFTDAIAPKIYLKGYESSFSLNNGDDHGGSTHTYDYNGVKNYGKQTTKDDLVATAQNDENDGTVDICKDSTSTPGSCPYTTQTAVTLECGRDYTDTTKPLLDAYKEAGAYVVDNVDGWDATNAYTAQSSDESATLAGGSTITITGTVDTEIPGDYTITYTAKDKNLLPAADVTRVMTVTDRIAPRLKITGDHTIQNSAGSNKVDANEHDQDYEQGECNEEGNIEGCFAHDLYKQGYKCVDQCTSEDDLTITTQLYKFDADTSETSGCDDAGQLVNTAGNPVKEGDDNTWTFPEYETGLYAILYTCTDEAENSATACRTIKNVDHTQPIIQILGSDTMQLEATHQGNYIDDGATCSDQVDGVISQNVEVSGDVVNLSKVGTYRITYNCKDAANRAAETAERVVTVAQTSCPTCNMVCATGATANSVVTGDQTVVSCVQQHEASFQYTDAGAACSDVIDGATDHTCTLSFVPGAASKVDNSRPEVAALAGDDVSCDGQLVNADRIGTYVITYRSVNSVGKANDDTTCRGGYYNYIRSVEVVDTLKPVITLRYDLGDGTKDIVAQGPVDDTTPKGTTEGSINELGTNHGGNHKGTENTPDSGISGQAAFSKQTLMAEDATTSGVNGWVLGAIASAVTGLALLGYSQRKTTVATSVPV